MDVNAGGDIETFAKTIESLTDSLPGDVILVPGHGSRNYSIDDLRNYRDMMAATTAVLRAEVEAGKTSDEIDEAVLEDWSECRLRAELRRPSPSLVSSSSSIKIASEMKATPSRSRKESPEALPRVPEAGACWCVSLLLCTGRLGLTDNYASTTRA